MKRLFLIFLLSTILSSCTYSTNPQTNESTDSNSSQTSIADTALDSRLFEDAISFNNSEFCSQIIDSETKNECTIVLSDLQKTETAISKLDKSLCDNLDLERYKEACSTKISSIIQSKKDIENESQEFSDYLSKLYKIQEEAVQLGDVNICNSIEDELIRATCKYNILAPLAIQKSDSTLCDQIGNVSLTANCKASF